MATRTMVGRPAAAHSNPINGLRTGGRRVRHLLLAINGTAPSSDVEAQYRAAQAVRGGEEEQRAAADTYLWHSR